MTPSLTNDHIYIAYHCELCSGYISWLKIGYLRMAQKCRKSRYLHFVVRSRTRPPRIHCAKWHLRYGIRIPYTGVVFRHLLAIRSRVAIPIYNLVPTVLLAFWDNRFRKRWSSTWFRMLLNATSILLAIVVLVITASLYSR